MSGDGKSIKPLDVGDVVFKYTGITQVKGPTSGFEPVIVELIEEFETEKGELGARDMCSWQWTSFERDDEFYD
jgi:hypothetical protein